MTEFYTIRKIRTKILYLGSYYSGLGLVDKNAATLQTEQKGCRSCTFKCEDEGVYSNVNDQSPRHEERARDAPLSSVWSRRQDLNLRPHGPEPCALPDCATPRRHAAGRLSARRYECYFTLFFIRCQMFVGGEPHFMRFSVSCPHVFHTFPRRAFSALRVRCGYILLRRKLFSSILARCGKRLLIFAAF